MGTQHSKTKPRRNAPDQSTYPVQPSPRPALKAGASPKPPRDPSKSKDVMISYSHQDIEAMRKLEAALKKAGVSVWVDEKALTPGAVFLREIGEAIVASHIFIVLLSQDSVQSKYCQDEVSLAYISNKSIFAVSLLPFDDISEVMDLGMKLTLSCVQWTFLNDGEQEGIKNFVAGVKAALEKIELETQAATEDHTYEEIAVQDKVDGNVKDLPGQQSDSNDEDAPRSTSVMNNQALTYRLKGKHDSKLLPGKFNVPDSSASDEFWKDKFGDVKVVEWDKFGAVMTEHMEFMWSQLAVSDETIKHLLTLMAQEMNVTNGRLLYKHYIMFCTKGKEVVALDEAISLFAAAAVAVREVFQIDSSVRLTAIENLGDHQSKAVINVLLDLLYDEDQDVRVVSAISLAHAASEIKSTKRRSEVVNGLLSCLSNDDRLVRESGCLALGRMKSKTAIKKLVYLWRNDYISTVREAAHIAIAQIGGDEAEQALHVTRVLVEEVSKLRT